MSEALPVGMPLLLMVARSKHDFFFRDIEILERKNNNNNNNKEFTITFLPNPFISHEDIGYSVITTSLSDPDTINIWQERSVLA